MLVIFNSSSTKTITPTPHRPTYNQKGHPLTCRAAKKMTPEPNTTSQIKNHSGIPRIIVSLPLSNAKDILLV